MDKNKNSLFGTSLFGIADVGAAVVGGEVATTTLSVDEENLMALSQEFNVAIPSVDLGVLSIHARAEVFDGVKAALKKIMMQDPKGREVLGGAVIEPLRKEQDYKSQMRRAFKPYALGAGQENWIPLDLDVSAFVTAVDGSTITQTPYGLEGVEVPLQRIETEILFHITDIRKGKYDLLGRTQTKTESEIFKEEDRRIASMFAFVSASGKAQDPVAVAVADFKTDGLYTIIDVVALVEGNEGLTMTATDLWMNPAHKAVFRRMSNYANGFQVSITQAEDIMKKGIFADFQGLRINASAVIPKEAVYITCDPEYFGAFVTSLDLMAIDQVVGASVGFIILEEVGFIVTNALGLGTIVVTYP